MIASCKYCNGSVPGSSEFPRRSIHYTDKSFVQCAREERMLLEAIINLFRVLGVELD